MIIYAAEISLNVIDDKNVLQKSVEMIRKLIIYFKNEKSKSMS